MERTEIVLPEGLEVLPTSNPNEIRICGGEAGKAYNVIARRYDESGTRIHDNIVLKIVVTDE